MELSSGSLLLPVLNVMYTVPPSPHASHGQLAICFLCCQPRVRLLLCCLEWVELQRKRKHFVNHVCKHCDKSVLLWATIISFFVQKPSHFLPFAFCLVLIKSLKIHFFLFLEMSGSKYAESFSVDQWGFKIATPNASNTRHGQILKGFRVATVDCFWYKIFCL